MNTTHTTSTAPVRVAANYDVTKHLGRPVPAAGLRK